VGKAPGYWGMNKLGGGIARYMLEAAMLSLAWRKGAQPVHIRIISLRQIDEAAWAG